MLFLSAFAGSQLAYVLTAKKKWLDAIWMFSSAYLLTITITHLVPELLELSGVATFHRGHVSHVHEEAHGNPYLALLLVILGFLLHRILEIFTKGIDHGNVPTGVRINPLVLLLSISIHAFIEGCVLLFNSEWSVLFAIIVHKVPAGFILGSMIFMKYKSSVKAWLLMAAFCLASPMGYLLTNWGLQQPGLGGMEPYLLALVTGTFLQLSLVLIWERFKERSLGYKESVYIGLGVLAALLLIVAE